MSATPPWMAEAPCRGKYELFFPPMGPGRAAPDFGPALAICATCDVRAECWVYAVDNGDIVDGEAVEGVVAGVAPLTKNERRGRVLPCGTNAAYKRHYYKGEEPCGPCREANARRTRRAS